MRAKKGHLSAIRTKKRAPEDVPASNRVNVRELRQNLSKYLLRVKAGEALEVAERGEPVARLVPLPNLHHPLADLIAEGKIIPATLSWEDLGPPLPAQPGPTLSEILAEMRSGER